MKLYTLSLGEVTEYGAADTEEEMREAAGDIDARFAYLPVVIKEVTVDGYEINLTPVGEDKPKARSRAKKDA